MPATRGDAYLGTVKIGGPPTYVRPVDWLPLPTVNPGEQKFVGLVAVHQDSANFVSVRFAGNYTVDWGDGTAPENFATNVVGGHSYVWANVPSSTLTSRGYRQAIVTVTPQAGQNLTTVDLSQKHASARTGQVSKWLDIKVGAPLCTNLALSSTSVMPRLLEQFEWVGTAAAGLASMNNMFINASSFQNLIGGRAMTANVIQFGSSSAQSMFTGCLSLTRPPDLDAAKGTYFAAMFYNCVNLEEPPTYDTRNGTDFSNMFAYCYALKQAPTLDTAKATTVASMFMGCPKLRTFPAFNLPLCTNLSNMFANCSTLSEAPAVTMGTGAINLSGMFSGCTLLKTIPAYSTATATNFTGMFTSCVSLMVVPALNMAACAASPGNIFMTCPSVERIQMFGCRFAVDISGCNLGGAQLNEFYANLGTASGAQTITVTGNWGTATDDPTLATAKGFTVTGS